MKPIVPLFIAAVLVAGCASEPREAAPSLKTALLPPGPPPGEPAGLVGLVASQVKVAYGAPSFVRKDGQTELWRYDGQTCRAFFFLYPENGNEVVHHVETIPRGQTMAADPGCLEALKVRSAASPAG